MRSLGSQYFSTGAPLCGKLVWQQPSEPTLGAVQCCQPPLTFGRRIPTAPIVAWGSLTPTRPTFSDSRRAPRARPCSASAQPCICARGVRLFHGTAGALQLTAVAHSSLRRRSEGRKSQQPLFWVISPEGSCLLDVFDRHYFICEFSMGRPAAHAPSSAAAATAQHAHPPPLLPPRSLILILL